MLSVDGIPNGSSNPGDSDRDNQLSRPVSAVTMPQELRRTLEKTLASLPMAQPIRTQTPFSIAETIVAPSTGESWIPAQFPGASKDSLSEEGRTAAEGSVGPHGGIDSSWFPASMRENATVPQPPKPIRSSLAVQPGPRASFARPPFEPARNRGNSSASLSASSIAGPSNSTILQPSLSPAPRSTTPAPLRGSGAVGPPDPEAPHYDPDHQIPNYSRNELAVRIATRETRPSMGPYISNSGLPMSFLSISSPEVNKAGLSPSRGGSGYFGHSQKELPPKPLPPKPGSVWRRPSVFSNVSRDSTSEGHGTMRASRSGGVEF